MVKKIKVPMNEKELLEDITKIEIESLDIIKMKVRREFQRKREESNDLKDVRNRPVHFLIQGRADVSGASFNDTKKRENGHSSYQNSDRTCEGGARSG